MPTETQISPEAQEFANVLHDLYDVPHEEGIRKYFHLRYGSISIHQLVNRMRVFSEFFGKERAKLYFGIHPDVFRIWLDRLPEHAEVFREDGFDDASVLDILERGITLCRLEFERLRTRHVSLCVLLPNRDQRHELIKAHPDVYVKVESRQMMNKRGLPWTDVETYWKELKKGGGYTLPDVPPKTGRPAKPMPAAQVWLEGRLAALGLEEQDAREAARSLYESFEDKADKQLELLLGANWSAKHVLLLTTQRQHGRWKKGVDNLLACERALCEIGLDPSLARNLVTKNGMFSTEDATRIKPAFETLLELEGQEFAVRALHHKPNCLFELPDTIRAWHAAMNIGKHKLFGMLYQVSEYTAERRAKREALAAKRQSEKDAAPKTPRERKPRQPHAERPAPTAPHPPPARFYMPDEDVRMQIPEVPRFEKKVELEGREGLEVATQALCNPRYIDMSKENAATFVLFRPKLIEHCDRLLPMLRLLSVLGYRRDALFNAVRANPGILLLYASKLEHVAALVQSRKGFTPPADPRDLFIPQSVFTSRREILEGRGVSPDDPRYFNALLARTGTAFEETLKPQLALVV